MTKVTTSATPSWFWNSMSFASKRLPDYTTFPDASLPSNKVSASMLRTEQDVAGIVSNKIPLERIGHNRFYTNLGGLTNYPASKRVNFTDFGWNPSNPHDESQWTLALNTEDIVWLNAETPLGYDGAAVAGNISKRDKLRSLIGAVIANSPTTKVCLYSFQAIGNLSQWYNVSGNISNLINPYSNTSLIYSAQVDVGCNSMLQQIYSFNDNNYDYPAYIIYQKQLAELKYGSMPLYGLLWMENETVDGFPFLHSMQRKRQDGQFINLSGAKANANAEYVYNAALVCLSRCDGLLGWEGVMPQIDSDDLSIEQEMGLVQTSIGTETWAKVLPRVWKGNRLYWDLAIQHISPNKDIIQATGHGWETPDFQYGNNIRTGVFKLVPYNKLYAEPVVQLKYNDAKTECVILVMNNWASNLSTKTVRVFDTTTGLNVTLPVKGTKAELYRCII